MKELKYPFNADYILKNKKQLKRVLLERSQNYTKKNIAILGGYTTHNIKLMLELFLLDQEILPCFYESEFNQFYQDAVFCNPALIEFRPDIIYICTSNRNISVYPHIQDSEQQVKELLSIEFKKYKSIWDSLTKQFNCPIIQNNFEMPLYRLMGNRDAYDIHGKVNYILRLNAELCKYANTHKNIYLCDINYLASDFGLSRWSDPFYWYMYKYAVSVEAIPYLAFNVSNIIKSIFGKNKKGMVLDLDNTLWGGIIGDDGVENIMLGPEEPEGQVFLDFQRYLKEHKELGIILNIDSKNEESNALEGLQNPYSVLTKEDFVVIMANWKTKDTNYKEIANRLNLSPESLVFIDDNPAERNIVASQIPGVVAPELGEIYNYINAIDRGGYFEVTSFTEDDKKRNEMYKQNAKRIEQQSAFSNYNEYLRSLKMVASVRAFESMYLPRIVQLINKSNQFNLTTRRYTLNEVEELAENPEFVTLYGKLEDKFGDNGVVTVVIGHILEDECQVDLWLMSCRVLKRDMEYAMMDVFVEDLQRRGIRSIRGYYYPTAKNAMVKDFYELQGFEKIYEDDKGNTEWVLNIGFGYKNKNDVIRVEK